jgi:nicotinamidase-related amidase
MNTPSAPRRALIVIDVQNEYFSGGGLPIEFPSPEHSLPRITRAMDAARAAGVPVVVVQHHAAHVAPVFQAAEHNGKLHPEVAMRERQHLVSKSKPSAFADTDLAEWLARHVIDTITIAGDMTHNCCAATAFEAMHRGLAVEFLADATGALPYANSAGRASAEEIHRVFCVVLQSNFAAVVATQSWIDAVHNGAPLAKDNVVMSNRRARASSQATAG